MSSSTTRAENRPPGDFPDTDDETVAQMADGTGAETIIDRNALADLEAMLGQGAEKKIVTLLGQFYPRRRQPPGRRPQGRRRRRSEQAAAGRPQPQVQRRHIRRLAPHRPGRRTRTAGRGPSHRRRRGAHRASRSGVSARQGGTAGDLYPGVTGPEAADGRGRFPRPISETDADADSETDSETDSENRFSRP